MQSISKSTEAYNYGLQLYNYYSSVYLRTFQQALKMTKHLQDDWSSKLNDVESLYDTWLRLMDREFDKELKSPSFTSILSKYVHSIIDLHSVYKRTGVPVDYIDWAFNSYMQSIVSLVTFSILKESELSGHDTIYLKGKTRLLHYHSIIKEKDETRYKPPLLIVYAPINRFHIMDLNAKRSVVRNLLSNGLDVYLLDLGYPTKEDDNLSLEDYVHYVKDSVQSVVRKGPQPDQEEENGKKYQF